VGIFLLTIMNETLILMEEVKKFSMTEQKKDGGNAITWYNQGVELAQKGSFAEAVSCFDKALAVDPKNTNTINTKGLALQRLGRLDEALACYNQVLAMKPGETHALNDKGQVLHLQGKYREAVTCYEKSLVIDASTFETWYNKALALVNLGEMDDAMKSLGQALKISPYHLQAMKLKQVLLRHKGKK